MRASMRHAGAIAGLQTNRMRVKRDDRLSLCDEKHLRAATQWACVAAHAGASTAEEQAATRRVGGDEQLGATRAMRA
jgi:hypothetical protein